MTKYLSEIKRSMNMLAENEKTIFVGQAIEYPGTAVTHQVKELMEIKKLEMPVAEDFQAGFCLGLALEGHIPICIYPRFNFAFLACNQIVNHVDKFPYLMKNSLPKIIFKVCVGSDKPLDPGYQHKGNYTQAFRLLCDTIEVVELTNSTMVYPAYEHALNREDGRSTIIVEHSRMYAFEPEWEW